MWYNFVWYNFVWCLVWCNFAECNFVWCLVSLLLQPLQAYYRKGPLIKWWWPALCYRKALCVVLKGRRLSRISFNRLSSFFSHIIRINISLRKTEFRCDFPYQAGGRGVVYTILGSGDLGFGIDWCTRLLFPLFLYFCSILSWSPNSTDLYFWCIFILFTFFLIFICQQTHTKDIAGQSVICNLHIWVSKIIFSNGEFFVNLDSAIMIGKYRNEPKWKI